MGVGLLLGACASSGSEGDGDRGAGGAHPAGTSVTIVTDGVERTLTCDPPGGTHPDPVGACAALTAVDVGVFQPVSADQMCTMIFGGPATATVVGTLDGEAIDASFSRNNGCEIARWNALGDVFFQPAESPPSPSR